LYVAGSAELAADLVVNDVTMGRIRRLDIGRPYWPAPGRSKGSGMDGRRRALIVGVLAILTGIGGVLTVEAVTGVQPGSTPAPSIAGVDLPRATTASALPMSSEAPSALPTSSRAPRAGSTVAPTVKAKPSPTAAPRWKATWSKPRLVDAEACGGGALGIDARSRYHLVSSCGGLRYSVTDGDGTWTTTSIDDPKAMAPFIALDGNQAYIAYWRILPFDPDTCGGFQWPPSAGIYYRHRTLPDGAWSKAIPFGKTGDHLTAFRVDEGVLHAIAWNGTGDQGHTVYIRSTTDPVVSARHRIDADGDVSLRIGDDGRARVAYWSGGSLRYGAFDGSRFRTSKVSSGPTNGPAMLILGPGNQAHIAYTIVRPWDGCGEPDGLSRAGTYYATQVNGKWASKRVTKDLDLTSIALDPRTGRMHVLVGHVLYTKAADRGWASAPLPAGIDDPQMRVDPATGTLLLVYDRTGPDGDSDGLVAITSP